MRKFYLVSTYCPVCGELGGTVCLLYCVKRKELIYHCFSCDISWDQHSDPDDFDDINIKLSTFCPDGIKIPSRNMVESLRPILEEMDYEDWKTDEILESIR